MTLVNVLVIRFNISELYERLFYGRFECFVWGIGSKQNTGVSKANTASSHIWLKTKLRIDSEILRLDPESLERESRRIDGSIFSPTPSVFWDQNLKFDKQINVVFSSCFFSATHSLQIKYFLSVKALEIAIHVHNNSLGLLHSLISAFLNLPSLVSN